MALACVDLGGNNESRLICNKEIQCSLLVAPDATLNNHLELGGGFMYGSLRCSI